MPIPQRSCPACHSDRRRTLPVAWVWNATDWRWVRCADCGHRYTDPMPDDAELTRMYDRAYFEAGGSWVCDFWEGSYLANEANLRQEARDALADLPIRSGRLLEIGCAGGFFLDEARRSGFDVTGCELNPEMAEYGRTTLGLTIHTGLFEQQGFPPHSFDVIAAQDVLEHTRNPQAFVRSVAALLKPGGIFFVRGPLEAAMRETIYHTIRTVGRRGIQHLKEPPFHLHGFRRESFRRILAHAGLVLDHFTAASTAPAWTFRTPKAVLATMIEQTAYQVDRLRGGGDFMTGRAVKSDPPPRSASATPTPLP